MDKKQKATRKVTLKDITDIAIVAALYCALTLALSPISYGNYQFRLSEILILLCFYNRKYSYSLILGCFIANCFSPLGWPDIVFGTLSTIIPCILICFSKHLIVATIWPSIFVGVIVGLELTFVYQLPVWITMLEVFVGEFGVVTIVGYPVFRLLEKNKAFLKLIDAKRTTKGLLLIDHSNMENYTAEESEDKVNDNTNIK